MRRVQREEKMIEIEEEVIATGLHLLDIYHVLLPQILVEERLTWTLMLKFSIWKIIVIAAKTLRVRLKCVIMIVANLREGGKANVISAVIVVEKAVIVIVVAVFIRGGGLFSFCSNSPCHFSDFSVCFRDHVRSSFVAHRSNFRPGTSHV